MLCFTSSFWTCNAKVGRVRGGGAWGCAHGLLPTGTYHADQASTRESHRPPLLDRQVEPVSSLHLHTHTALASAHASAALHPNPHRALFPLSFAPINLLAYLLLAAVPRAAKINDWMLRNETK